jgi:hypothetical protein
MVEGYLAMKMAYSGLVSQKQCAGALKRDDSGMVIFKRGKSLFVMEGDISFQDLQ